LIDLLLELGADPFITNHDGTSTLMAVAGIGVVNPTDGYPGTFDEFEAAFRMLLDLGLDINRVDKNQETTMHGAAYRNWPQAVRLVALLGATPETWDHKNKFGWSPLLIAKGYRPGSFKPDPPTIEAVQEVMGDRLNLPQQKGESLKWEEP
ncbi:MAG: ankyrin repeat domain-containing protein, partial [Planctomycetota bacterium]